MRLSPTSEWLLQLDGLCVSTRARPQLPDHRSPRILKTFCVALRREILRIVARMCHQTFRSPHYAQLGVAFSSMDSPYLHPSRMAVLYHVTRPNDSNTFQNFVGATEDDVDM